MEAYFTTAYSPATGLGKAARDIKIEAKLPSDLTPKAVDEVDYLPLHAVRATIFFQLAHALYERGLIILTSNKKYTD